MEAHKRVIGILYIISGALQIIIMLTLATFFSMLFPMIFDHADIQEEWVLVWIVPFIRVIAVSIILCFAIPSIIGGWAVLNGKKWGLTLVLVMGCFKLFSFPVGTALGIYTIWVYNEEHRKKAPAQ